MESAADAPLTDAQPVQAVQAATYAQADAPPGTPDATKAVPVDANYSAFLGAVVHALAELYGIKDDAKVVITSDMVSAANFTATLEVKDGKLTITLTPVDDSAGPAALEAIKLRLAEALKPAAVVSPAPAEVQAPAPAEVQAPAPAVVSPAPAVETDALKPSAVETDALKPSAVETDALKPSAVAAADKAAADKAAADKAAADKAAADKAAADKAAAEAQAAAEANTLNAVENAATNDTTASGAPLKNNLIHQQEQVAAAGAGGYRRRKRNLRTIKKQQQRNRKTMNKH
jgi:hypothetical protein